MCRLSKLLPIVVLGTSLATAARCQWVEESYSVTITNTSLPIDGFNCLVDGPVVWNAATQNWFYVVGSATQDPAWRMLFANLCTNLWTATGPVWSETFSAGDSVIDWDNCELQSGSESFWHYSDGVVDDTAERDLSKDGGPGYHVTDSFSYTVTHGGGGGGPE